jgi:putative PIN family toxin of toxin-antitoxin system
MSVRIVLDTNVVLSALLWRGTPYRLFAAVRQREQVQLFTSTVLLEELAEVLIRPTLTQRLALIGRTAGQVLADSLEAVDVVTPFAAPSVITSDPDDDNVLAGAVAAGAELVVSGDRHLLALGTHQGVRIIAPAEALRIITLVS